MQAPEIKGSFIFDLLNLFFKFCGFAALQFCGFASSLQPEQPA
jgi:hypothetical protein